MPIAYIKVDLLACRMQIRPVATPETISSAIPNVPSALADVISSLKAIQASMITLIASIEPAAAIQRRSRATSVAPLDKGVGAMASAVHASEQAPGNMQILLKQTQETR